MTKPNVSTASTLIQAVRKDAVEVDNTILESSLFRELIEREKTAAVNEIALLNTKISQLMFRVEDLQKIVFGADRALEAIDGNMRADVEMAS